MDKIALSRDSISKKVAEIIVEQLGVNEDQVTPGARFIEDLSADSLDIVELIMKFEEEFSMKIPDDAVQEMSKVEDAVDYIVKNLGSDGAAKDDAAKA